MWDAVHRWKPRNVAEASYQNITRAGRDKILYIQGKRLDRLLGSRSGPGCVEVMACRANPSKCVNNAARTETIVAAKRKSDEITLRKSAPTPSVHLIRTA